MVFIAVKLCCVCLKSDMYNVYNNPISVVYLAIGKIRDATFLAQCFFSNHKLARIRNSHVKEKTRERVRENRRREEQVRIL